jgi:hypothetical protein
MLDPSEFRLESTMPFGCPSLCSSSDMLISVTMGSERTFAAPCTNGRVADNLPFSIWIVVEVATRLSSTLRAKQETY